MSQIAVAKLTAEALAPFGSYNLELVDTNTVDYTVSRLAGPVSFAP